MNYPTIELYFNNSWHNAADLNLQSFTIREVSRSASELNLSFPCAINEEPFIREKQDIIIHIRFADDSGAYIFNGIVTSVEFDAYTCSVTAKNIWYLLESIVYQVPWALSTNAYNKSHVILCRDENGNRMSVGAQIRAALDFAIASGINLAYVPADLDALTLQPPVDEQTDVTVAELITKLLRWYPDVTTSLNYAWGTGGYAGLRFFKPADATAVIKSANQCSERSLKIKKLEDRKVRGVVINYEIQNDIIDGTTQEIQTDSHGLTSGPFVLVHTASLDGSYVENSESSINLHCQAWPANWKSTEFAKLMCAPNIYPNSFCKLAASFPQSIPYPYYVTSGYKDGYGVDVQQITVKWIIKEKWRLTGALSQGGDPWYKIPCDQYEQYSAYIDKEYTRTFLFTNSPSGTYNRTDQVVIPGEEIPSGTAETIFANLNRDHWSGSFEHPFAPSATSDIWMPGQQKINITDHRVEYSTMNEPLTDITTDWLSRTRRVSFGPPEHLGPADYISLLEENRKRNQATRRTWRT